MSKRTERRAAERESRKLAFQQLRQQSSQSAPVVVAAAAPEVCAAEQDLFARAQAFFNTTPEVSDAQLAANRTNAQVSTGPKSTEGKARSSMNALKHGLTSQSVVIAGEDTAEYNRQLDAYTNRLKPVDEEEMRLVHSLVDSNWRLSRLLRMESAIFLKGNREFAGKFEESPAAERDALILAEVYLKYEKSLRNLNTQEARLRRSVEKDKAELTRLQTIRKREEQMAAEVEPTSLRPHQPRPLTEVFSENGFVFSSHSKPISKVA